MAKKIVRKQGKKSLRKKAGKKLRSAKTLSRIEGLTGFVD